MHSNIQSRGDAATSKLFDAATRLVRTNPLSFAKAAEWLDGRGDGSLQVEQDAKKQIYDRVENAEKLVLSRQARLQEVCAAQGEKDRIPGARRALAKALRGRRSAKKQADNFNPPWASFPEVRFRHALLRTLTILFECTDDARLMEAAPSTWRADAERWAPRVILLAWLLADPRAHLFDRSPLHGEMAKWPWTHGFAEQAEGEDEDDEEAQDPSGGTYWGETRRDVQDWLFRRHETRPLRQGFAKCVQMAVEHLDDQKADASLADETGAAYRDGPRPPKMFRWHGQEIQLPPRQWQLLNFLWNNSSHTAEVDTVADHVWGNAETKDGTIRKACSSLNEKLLNVPAPAPQVRTGGGHVFIDFP
ncbi:MAG: helix-turn-helix domain-containing protein [Phycisphaeraceae bacterium]